MPAGTAVTAAPLRHFVVLQHGSHGSTSDFAVFRSELRAVAAAAASAPGGALPGETAHVTVFETNVNAGLRSDAGALLCAARLRDRLIPAFDRWAKTTGTHSAADGSGRGVVERGRLLVSCVGHSFGGILLRAVLPDLVAHAAGLRKRVEFHTFITIASPHCGVRCSLHPLLLLGAIAIGKVYSQTYLDVTLHSDVLTDELVTEQHLAALRVFRRRVLFANVEKDILVSFSTASLNYSAAEDVRREARATAAAGTRSPLTPHLLSPLRSQQWTAPASTPTPAHPGKSSCDVQGWLPSISSVARALCALALRPSSLFNWRNDETPRKIAATLCATMPWTVIPVSAAGVLPVAHNTCITDTPIAAVMRDVLRAAVDLIMAAPCEDEGELVALVVTAGRRVE